MKGARIAPQGKPQGIRYDQPGAGVAGIVFAGSVFDWRQDAVLANTWAKQLPDSMQRAIEQWKKDGGVAQRHSNVVETYRSPFIAPIGGQRNRSITTCVSGLARSFGPSAT